MYLGSYLCLATLFYVFSAADIICHKGHKVVATRGDPVCLECDPGKVMPEDNHSNTACISCQQIPENLKKDSYVASACNIIGNNTAGNKDHHGRPMDIASFNCSHVPAEYKNCLGKEIHSGDPNQTGNITDQCTSQSATAVGEFFVILWIVCTVGFIFLLIKSALVKWKVWGSAWSLLPIKYMIDKRESLAVYLFIILFVTSVSHLITVLVEGKIPENAFILLLRSVVVLGVGAAGAIAVSYVFLLQHVLEKTDPVSSRSTSDEADETD